jgi:hypothetical protein
VLISARLVVERMLAWAKATGLERAPGAGAAPEPTEVAA